MGDYADLLKAQQTGRKGSSAATDRAAKRHPHSEIQSRPAEKHESQSLSSVNDQSVDQSTDWSARLPLPHHGSKVVDRPKAFYITQRLDHRIDDAVRYFQEQFRIRKVDRSTVVNAMLDNDELWGEEALDRLADRVISYLTSRLTDR